MKNGIWEDNGDCREQEEGDDNEARGSRITRNTKQKRKSKWLTEGDY